MTTRRRRLVVLTLGLAAAVLAADQLTKVWALATLEEGERIPLVGDLLGLTLLFNPGAALGIASGMTVVLTLAAVGVAVVILRVAGRLGSVGWAVGLGLLLGGALGNLGDRLFRAPGVGRGHVVDFIAYADWFVGNVADVAIVVAGGLIVLQSLRGTSLDGTRHDDAADGSDADDRPDGGGPAPEPDGAPTSEVARPEPS